MRHLPAILAVALLAAGCAAMPAAPDAAGQSPGATRVGARPAAMSVRGAMKIRDAKGFALKALVTPNDRAAIRFVEVWLGRDGAEPAYVGQASGEYLVLNNLRLDASYVVVLKAYKDDPNAAGGHVCMSDDAQSTTTFDTYADWTSGHAAYPETKDVTFALRLSDQVFAGTASGNVAVTEGVVTSTIDLETLEGGVPGPSPSISPAFPDATGMIHPAFVRFGPTEPVTLLDLGVGDPCAPQLSSTVSRISFGTITRNGEFGSAWTYEVTCGGAAPALTPPPSPPPLDPPPPLPDATGMTSPMFVFLVGFDTQYRLVDWADYQHHAEAWCPAAVRTSFDQGTLPALVDGNPVQIPANSFECWYPNF